MQLINKFLTMSDSKKLKNKKYSIGGFLFVGWMFIGTGIGSWLNAMQIGMYLGMGAGFIAMALSYLLIKPEKTTNNGHE